MVKSLNINFWANRLFFLPYKSLNPDRLNYYFGLDVVIGIVELNYFLIGNMEEHPLYMFPQYVGT